MVFKSPEFTKNKAYTLNSFSGICSVGDKNALGQDRLASGENVWNKNGLLSNRPGFKYLKDGIINDFLGLPDFDKIFYADFPIEEMNEYGNLFALVNESGPYGTSIHLFVANKSGNVKNLTFMELMGAMADTVYDIKNILFIKDAPVEGCGIFLLMPILTYGIDGENETRQVYYYELSSDYSNLIRISPQSFYRPIIMKHGFGNDASAEVINKRVTTYPEEVNLLGGNFEACFNADNRSINFSLPVKIASGAAVTVHLYTSSRSYVTFDIYGNSSSSNPVSLLGKNYVVMVSRDLGQITFTADGLVEPAPMLCLNNGIRVLSQVNTEKEAYELLSRHSRPISFDGRLFFPGGENCNNLIYYSGKDLPLYYCQSQSIAVGNPNYGVTALSLQSKYVVAFKERELYRLTINESNKVTREAIISNDSITKKPMPTYKITRINDCIGCDMPTTIINCGNRLVWYHSDGAVYTLYGSNLYTEGSVYELSSDIAPHLKNIGYEDKKRVFGAEFDGFYLLGIGNTLYLMDTRVDGFRYLAGHKAANKKYSGLPWFIWKAPLGTQFVWVINCGGNGYFLLRTGSGSVYYLAELSGETDLVPSRSEDFEEILPEFSFSTPIIGDSLSYSQRLSVTAAVKNDVTLTIEDSNAALKAFSFKGDGKMRSYTVPLQHHIGGVGLTLSGAGNFILKALTYEENRIKP
ncbi:MAG: hypothetical protein IJ946_06840 [Clostridia bacterium]|nr:hypothetical protein [Clostridia bacterium]